MPIVKIDGKIITNRVLLRWDKKNKFCFIIRSDVFRTKLESTLIEYMEKMLYENPVIKIIESVVSQPRKYTQIINEISLIVETT